MKKSLVQMSLSKQKCDIYIIETQINKIVIIKLSLRNGRNIFSFLFGTRFASKINAEEIKYD
jgi:hypothetical protein